MASTPVLVVYKASTNLTVAINADDPAMIGQVILDLMGEGTELILVVRTANLETPEV